MRGNEVRKECVSSHKYEDVGTCRKNKGGWICGNCINDDIARTREFIANKKTLPMKYQFKEREQKTKKAEKIIRYIRDQGKIYPIPTAVDSRNRKREKRGKINNSMVADGKVDIAKSLQQPSPPHMRTHRLGIKHNINLPFGLGTRHRSMVRRTDRWWTRRAQALEMR